MERVRAIEKRLRHRDEDRRLTAAIDASGLTSTRTVLIEPNGELPLLSPAKSTASIQ